MPASPSPYRTLGVDPSASKDTLRSRHKQLALLHRPDKNQGGNHEVWIQYQTAYEEAMTALDKARVSLSYGPPPTTESQEERFTAWAKDNAAPKPSPKPSSSSSQPSWPIRKTPTTLPNPDTLPSDFRFSSTPSREPHTRESLKTLHTTHLNRLADLQTLSSRLNTHLLTTKSHIKHPNLCLAAEHISSFLLAESRLHKTLFSLIEKSKWWKKSKNTWSGERIRVQIQWYISVYIHGAREQLEEMLMWLEGWLQRYIVEGQKWGEMEEEGFVRRAREWCPEDERDAKERVGREKKLKEEVRGEEMGRKG